MADNHQNDTYMYEIVVETGPFLSSQVKCNIQFILFGENDITEIRKLNDETRDLFRSGSFDSFLLSTNRPLGPLLRLLIWTDSMGFGDAGSWNRKMRESRLNEGINIAINKKTLDIKVEGHQRKKNAIEKRRNRSYHYIFGIISWIFCFMIICTSITATIGIVDDHTEEDEEPPKIYFDINDNESIDRRPRNETPNRIHLDKDFKQRLKELRSSEFEMRQVIKELLAYFCYLSIVLIICFGPRDPNAHWEKKNIVVNVIHGGAMCEIYPNDDSRYRPCIETRASTDFQKIRDINDWWKWVETTLIPNTRVQPWYNDRPPYGFRGYLNDRVNRLIGYAIVRQVRQKIGVCRTHPFVREHIKDCLGEGSISSEDTTSWCENWKAKFLEPNCTEAPEYQYLSATELESLTVSGKINTYSGGGYVLRLQGYIGDLQKRIKKLQQDNWTDNRTRGLLAEFSVYNAQINMFATVTCIAFCSFFYFVLRNDLEKFRDFLRSFENTLAMSIGKFNFSELRDANLLAAWIFFAFSIAINMVLINMVMSIINLAFEEVKESKSISKNKFHLLQYAKNMTAQMIGIQNPKLIEPVYDIQESNKVIRENHLSKKSKYINGLSRNRILFNKY
ncbi:PKD1L2 [Lepeophtheirus salmonis]|uniref:PKD1L2 n=1 Tax=Lepeophtheirus salmonis TaxID=72036 RepID=A0A7R8CMU8_LEPSM|nr:PKD1L2 [Lepeophtheirus salmonis]CAF2869496.1 PKD1L2 [Lepeophtheirus salmonis]